MRKTEDAGTLILCVSTLRNLLDAMEQETEGVKAGKDSENVHRMRVASRRIRAAMAIFEDCFPARRFKTWRKEIKNVTRMLGEARDTDVQIYFLEGLKKEQRSPKALPGIDFMLEAKRKIRAELQVPLISALNEMQERGTIEEITSFLDQIKAEVKDDSPIHIRTQGNLILAREKMNKKIRELLEHQPFVHDPQAILEHHAMRIAAKRLRYTMEAFRPLFDDGLAEEIKVVKKVQELLGDLHDCDVWIMYIDSVMKVETKDMRKMRPGIEAIRKDRASRRVSVYKEFVDYWDALMENDFIKKMEDRLQPSTMDASDSSEKIIERIISEPSRSITLIGDVHGNIHALEAILKDAESHGSAIIMNTGDFLGYGAFPEQVVQLVKSKGALSVIGNFDLKVFRVHEKKEKGTESRTSAKSLGFEWAYDNISDDSRGYLRSLPQEIRFQTVRGVILMTHGSPDSLDEHLGPETPKRRLEDIARSAGADIIVTGHSHRPMVRKVKGAVFINAGSVGRQDDGDPRASYAIMRLRPFSVKHYRVEYDTKAAAQGIKDKGLPVEFAEMVLKGRSFDFVSNADTPAKGRNEDEEGRRQKVRAVSRSYLGSDEHTTQVCRLALSLFDCLRQVHGLGTKERFWLESAAWLHDIGWVEGRGGHHKTALRMILEEDDLPFSKKERKIVGCVARYHRKALPSDAHAHFATLNEKDKMKVEKLAALIRVADGLDVAHSGIVRSLECESTSDAIIVRCGVQGDPELEERETMKKGDLIQKVFGRGLHFVWDVAR